MPLYQHIPDKESTEILSIRDLMIIFRIHRWSTCRYKTIAQMTHPNKFCIEAYEYTLAPLFFYYVAFSYALVIPNSSLLESPLWLLQLETFYSTVFTFKSKPMCLFTHSGLTPINQPVPGWWTYHLMFAKSVCDLLEA